ncbi:MAG TPA: hypothetical protein VGA98_04195 [Allosphingosinicella sp.]
MTGGLVLRCPNCGTVQPTSGECEACREAAVRYFCGNHVPGIWVDSPSCPRCGARFGDPAPVREAPPPAERPRARPTELIEPGPGMYGRDDDLGPWAAGGPAGSGAPGGDRGARPDAGRLLLAMLGAAARARRGRPERFGYDEEPRRRRRGGGCIGRLLMLALLLFALFLMAPLLLGALLGFR